MATVGDRMSSPILSIEQGESIKNAAEKIYSHKVGSLLVTCDQNPVGIITKTDLMVRVLINNIDADSTPVADVMSQPLITIDAQEPLDSAQKLFSENSFRHLPVRLNDAIVGVLSIKDL